LEKGLPLQFAGSAERRGRGMRRRGSGDVPPDFRSPLEAYAGTVCEPAELGQWHDDDPVEHGL
jgi:hypothetical protein